MAMMDLSEQIENRYYKKPEKPFRVFLDEFYNLAYPRFIDFINKCREAEVNIFMAHQSLGDLRGISEEFMEQVMNTARNKIILGLDDPETAEYFARQFGTVRDMDYKVESYGKDGTLMGYSKPLVEKFVFHPNQIKTLKTGQAVVKVVGPNGPTVFPIQLSPATPNPNSYSMSVPNRNRSMDKKNESGLAEHLKYAHIDDKPQIDDLGVLMGK
jgi:type IV secretory pathway TraG/TraD family ATPase VirD4